MNIYEVLGIVAAVLHVAGYATYYYLCRKEIIQPNAASWLIWFYGNAIVLFSYTKIATFSFVDLLPYICAIASIVITTLFFIEGQFAKLDRFERRMVSIDIFITALWLLIENNTFVHSVYTTIIGTSIEPYLFVHLLLQVSVVVSFLPIIRETWKMPSLERPLPWMFWTVAYGLWFLAEILRSDGVFGWQMVYPINYAILHGIVFAFSKYKKRV